jgi:hypothetical protein
MRPSLVRTLAIVAGALGAGLSALGAGLSEAPAQARRPWIDPPADLESLPMLPASPSSVTDSQTGVEGSKSEMLEPVLTKPQPAATQPVDERSAAVAGTRQRAANARIVARRTARPSLVIRQAGTPQRSSIWDLARQNSGDTYR